VDRRAPTGFRFQPEDRSLLEALATRFGSSMTETVVRALRLLRTVDDCVRAGGHVILIDRDGIPRRLRP
jgi:hypothetical protein